MKQWRKRLDVPQECILFGNGASELFVAIIHARKPKTVLVLAPSFSGYEHSAACEDCQGALLLSEKRR